MTDRPILFSGSMVRAILAGTKTQTRRIVTPQPKAADPTYYADRYNGGPEWAFWRRDDTRMSEPRTWKPYAEAGDALRVRETWRVADASEGEIAYQADGRTTRFLLDGDADFWKRWGAKSERERWCPSIYLPRWASRITLLVEDVRVERLQAISGADALAEGISIPVTERGNALLPISRPGFTQALPKGYKLGARLEESDLFRAHYADLWDSINSKRAPWASNPWVWVVTFKRMEER